MAIVILRKEPRHVSGRLLKPGERCTVPDSLARAMETRGLCEIVGLENRLEREVEIKAQEAAERKAPAPEKPKPKKPTVKKKAAKKKEQE